MNWDRERHGMEFDVGGLPSRSVAVVYGTRPEIIKLSRIIAILGDRAFTIYSGQHFDRNLAGDFIDELALAAPDLTLHVGGVSRAQQIAQVLSRLGEQFSKTPPAVVVVQGDTNTTVGAALAANASEIPLVHVEAGLRSFDRRMPEEHNRVTCDHLADSCLAPTETSRQNLLAEGIADERIAVTGNTVVDVATQLLQQPEQRRSLTREMELEPSRFVLATFHRPENVDDRARLRTILEELRAVEAPILFPIHPRTLGRIQHYRLDTLLSGVRVVPPLGYRAFLNLAAESAFIISDSGGVQEEASVLKRPVIVVRRSTERPEVLGSFSTLVTSLEKISAAARSWLEDVPGLHQELAQLESPYGDGRASERSVDAILRALENGA
jgi:UDP-N-acetylglucosamine 2-epimerase (non-hydrolysing)